MNDPPMQGAPVIAQLRIARDHAAYAGHFPGFPILPGAALLDAALQEIIGSRDLDLRHWRVAVKFLDIVSPGDLLTLEHSANSETSIHFIVRNPGGAVASGTLAALAVPRGADGH